MTDMRRTVLWVVFSLSLLFLWDGWQKHNGHPSMFAPPAPQAAASAGVPASVPGAMPAAAQATAAAASAPAMPAPAVSEQVTISTDLFKATLDTRGGTVTRVELLKQKDAADASGHVVVLDTSASRFYQAQTGLTGVAGAPSHLSLMRLVSGERALADGADALTLRFESAEEGGLKLVKTYTFKRAEYVVGVKHEVVNMAATALTPQLYVQLARDSYVPPTESSMAPSAFTGPAVYTDKSKFKKVEFADIDKGNAEFEKRAQDGWVAMAQHYFASAWLHQAAGERGFFASKVAAVAGGAPAHYAVGMVFPLPQLGAGASVTAEDQLFVGPEEEKLLEKLAPGLELVRDYGIFTVLAKPLFWLLDQLHGLTGNWGWAIIGLVVLLKIAFYWLNASAFRSMAKMKAVAPRIQALNERFKDKPQEKQQEMMRIYKEEKINPLGSCLPILVQMPFFIALYSVLLASVEMRHAPWLGWISDLSVKDPWFILPVIMTITSLIQTWLNPTPADPVQAKMMWIMPLMFSVMFVFFPAGLVLYWVTNNILTIAQQWMINRQLGVNK